MRKYRFQLVVTRPRCAQCEKSHVRHIDVPLTEFIAVTSYNNHNLKQLKIENNPRARYLLDDDNKKGVGYSKRYNYEYSYCELYLGGSLGAQRVTKAGGQTPTSFCKILKCPVSKINKRFATKYLTHYQKITKQISKY